MTVTELRARMSTAEYAEWQGYHLWKRAKEKRADDDRSRSR